ncbi:hypothetical protein QUF70_04980 [Desulfobacterales bacterium HSG17]|nr:hypothetical protein [Desulfobacterales bacterium HSG17]
MKIEDSPVFRKYVIPWYDSETACLITLMFLYFIFLFGIIGISVARGYHEYYKHIWVPVLLMVMSGLTIMSITVRLLKRYIQQRKIQNKGD